jgi:hypothetical protein
MRTFLFWAAALVLLRSALVISLGDAFFYGEELEKGAAGKAMLDGLGIPHHKLAYHYYEGGGFVVSHLKAAAFYLFGQSVMANKIVALFSCLAVLWAGWWSCGRAFGRASANAFCALYVFAPAAVQKLSMISLGIHHEACFFILLALGLSSILLERQTIKNGFLLGLCLGFGVYFSWVVALAAATCALALLFRWRQAIDGQAFFACLAGALVGALPILLMIQEVGGAVLDIHGTGLGDQALRSTSEVLREFLRSIYVEGALGGFVGVWVWPAFAVGAIIVGLRRDWSGERPWRRAFLCFAAFLGIFLLAYLSSAFVQGKVYHFFLMLRLVPLWIVSAVLIAAVAGRGYQGGGARGPIALAFSGLILVGAINTVRSFRDLSPRAVAANTQLLNGERGYVYPSYFAKLIPHLEGDAEERLRVLLRFEETSPTLLREGIAMELFRRANGQGATLEDDYLAARAVIDRVEPVRFEDYARGFGPLLVDWYGADLVGCMQLISAAEADAPLLAEALGRTGSGSRPMGEERNLASVELRFLYDIRLVEGEEHCEAFTRGVGWRLHWLLHRTVLQPWRASDVIAGAPAQLQASFRAGYEAARSQGLLASNS